MIAVTVADDLMWADSAADIELAIANGKVYGNIQSKSNIPTKMCIKFEP